MFSNVLQGLKTGIFIVFSLKSITNLEKKKGEIHSKLSLETTNNSYRKTNTDNDCIVTSPL